MDPGVLPSRYVSIMAFEFRRDDATRESYDTALFDCWNVQNIRVDFSGSHKQLPMGVIDLYFEDSEVEVLLSTKGSRLRLIYLLSSWSIAIGYMTNAPDISSPRVYGRVLVADRRLHFLVLLFFEFFLEIVFYRVRGQRSRWE
jgi:hypothetical protein